MPLKRSQDAESSRARTCHSRHRLLAALSRPSELANVVVLLAFGWNDIGRQNTAVILRHAVLPLEKLGNRLRLDTDFHPPQAGQQQIHFVHQTGWRSMIVAWRPKHDFNLASVALQKPPAIRHLLRRDESAWNHVEALAAETFAVFSKRLVQISEEVGARRLALNHDRSAAALPANRVRCLAAYASLFGQDNTATVAAQPGNRPRNELGMSHAISPEWLVEQ